MTKTCKDCGVEKPLSGFHLSGLISKTTGEPYRQSRCGPCRSTWRKSRPNERIGHNRNRRERYATDPVYREEIRQRNRLYLYGIDEGWVQARLASQGGCCRICGKTDPGKHDWHIDHDHGCCSGERSCGRCIRGLLCGNCNLILGHAADSPDTLMSAATYLLTFQDVLGPVRTV